MKNKILQNSRHFSKKRFQPMIVQVKEKQGKWESRKNRGKEEGEEKGWGERKEEAY